MKERLKVADKKVKLTNEIIEGIRLIKMYAWQDAFKKMVEIHRKREMSLLLK